MIWEEITTKSEKLGVTVNQVLQEEIQKTVLASLSYSEAFNHIVFQGGTALRLFYGNPRFSEDLDFVTRQNKMFDITKNIASIQRSIEKTFPFIEETSVHVQRNDDQMQRLILRVTGEPFQRIRIHIELVYVPSYHNRPKILDYPPITPVVRVEEPSEILADKVVALGNRHYIKGRDIWDIYFLIIEKNIDTPWNLVFQKAGDYKITSSDLRKNILKVSKRLETEGPSILHNELLRFLPKKIFDQYRESFGEIIAVVIENIRGGLLEE